MTERSAPISEPGIWRPALRRVPALSLLGAPASADCVPLPATRWLARLTGAGAAGVAAGRHPVRESWLAAAAGGVAIAFVAVSAMVAAGAVAAVGGDGVAATATGLLWGGLMTAAYRVVLRDGPRHRARWRRAVTVLWAAGVGLVAAAPLRIVEPLDSPDGPGVIGRTLASVLTLVGPPVLVALAVLPVPTMWRRSTVAVPEVVSSVYVTQVPLRCTIRLGFVARASLWLGGQRDDVAGRWPVTDRLHHVRAGLVGSCLLLGGVAAGTALEAATGDVVVAAGAGVLWGWTCAAVARHHVVVADEASGRRARLLSVSSGVASTVIGACTGALLSIGVLARMAPLPTAEPVSRLGHLLPVAEAGGVARFTTLTVLAFALFVQLLPVLPWPAGGVLAVQRRLVTLLDIATLSADRDQENECPPGAGPDESLRSKGVNRE